MKEKNYKAVTVIIIILLIIVIGLVVFVCHDKLGSKNVNVDETNTVTENESNATPISIDSDTVKLAMEKFNGIRTYDKELYAVGGYNISNITDENVILTALDGLDEKYISPCNGSYKAQVATIDVINATLEKYILNKKITLEDIRKVKEKSDAYDYVDLKENGVIIRGSCGGIWYPEDYVEKKIVKAETEDDYLYVYEVTAFARYIEDDMSQNVNYFSDFERKNVMEKNKKSLKVTPPEERTEKDNPNWDLYNTYKYTFKKVNGSYYFQSLELLRIKW